MRQLDHFQHGARLFTYKVAHDGGSAPNPDQGVCTLGICKPAIRRVAQVGDVVVGLDCAPDDARIIYVMVVDHVLPWGAYIQACMGIGEAPDGIRRKNLKSKVPTGPNHTGDCIWPSAQRAQQALPSWSGHAGPGDFDRDVRRGKNVILSIRFWYFGDGKKYALRLEPGELRAIIPGRGHRSCANDPYMADFVDFFNRKLRENGIAAYGKHGVPALGPGIADESARSRCQAEERASDDEEEEGLLQGAALPRRC